MPNEVKNSEEESQEVEVKIIDADGEDELIEELVDELPDAVIESIADLEMVTEPEPESEADDFKAKWIHARADLDNLRKRSSRELFEARKRDQKQILLRFIEIVDNFERALDGQDADENPWLVGIDAIRQQMAELLGQYGIGKFDALGEIFDPNRHDAVARVNVPDEDEGRIIDVAEAGYQGKDGEVLRPAKVIVAHSE